MCNPVALTWAVQAATMYASHTQQEQQAEAQTKAMQNQLDADYENNLRAREAQGLQQRANLEGTQQQNSKVAQQIQNRQREALRERASIRSATAEAGIGGASANRSLLSVALSEGEAVDQLRVQQGFNNINLGFEQKSAQMTADNRMIDRYVPKQAANRFGNFMQIAGSVASGYKAGAFDGAGSQPDGYLSGDQGVASQKNVDFYNSGPQY